MRIPHLSHWASSTPGQKRSVPVLSFSGKRSFQARPGESPGCLPLVFQALLMQFSGLVMGPERLGSWHCEKTCPHPSYLRVHCVISVIFIYRKSLFKEVSQRQT